MTISAYSDHWHRVRDLKPRLTDTLRIERHLHRGEPWYTLVPERGGAVRMNAAAYAFVGRLDGVRAIGSLWDALVAEDAQFAPRQDEVIAIMSELNLRGLLQPEAGTDFDALFRGWSGGMGKTRRSWNPVAMRFTLGNPRRLLDALAPFSRSVFRPSVLALWAFFVGYAALAAAAHWRELAATAAKWMGTPHYALLGLAVYVVIKAIHEIFHGLAARRWGCPVDSFGVTLFLLMPLPFVDASASAALRSRLQRISISAAGIMAELVIASVALTVWLNAQPGLVRDIAFVTAFAAGVSTVLVNANPLLRFDGYYIFIDALDLPNLAQRSARYWGELAQARVLRIAVDAPLAPSRGERPWLIAYAPLSWLYRVVLCAALTTWVGSHSFVLGVLAGAAFLVMLLQPLVRGLLNVARGAAAGSPARTRALFGLGGGIAALVIFLTLVPMPYGASLPGVLWLPDNARVRAGTDGFVVSLVAHDGARVAEGDVLIELQNDALETERAQLVSKSAALEAELFKGTRRDTGTGANVAEELSRVTAELARVTERIAGLTLRAGCAGTFAMPRELDLPGSFARQGAMLGHIVPQEPPLIRVAVPQEDAALVRASSRVVEARLGSAPGESVPGALERDGGGAVSVLPSAALSTRYGGTIVTDPNDQSALKLAMPVVLIDVRLPGRAPERFGERAWVRFEYQSAPLATQWARRARQIFLGQFSPAA